MRGPRDIELERDSTRRKRVQAVRGQGSLFEIGERANDPSRIVPQPELAVRFVEPETGRFRNAGDLSPRKRRRNADDMDGNPDIDFSAKAIELRCLAPCGRRVGHARKGSHRRGSFLYCGTERGQLLGVRCALAVHQLHAPAQPRIAAIGIKRLPGGRGLVEALQGDRFRAALEGGGHGVDQGRSGNFRRRLDRNDEVQELRQRRPRSRGIFPLPFESHEHGLDTVGL